ncbi:DUF4132 domain-containing protein [Paludisphaera sp.]|uniref:DUF4132 domain-containing protein n=1 Tax=Paludisphaera sp. TaxID=2017432 RepID=UPI00301D06DA
MGQDQATAPEEVVEGLIDALLAEECRGKYGYTYGIELKDTQVGPGLLALDRDTQAAAVGRLLERLAEADRSLEEIRAGAGNPRNPHSDARWGPALIRRQLAEVALRALLRRKLPLSDGTLKAILGWLTTSYAVNSYWIPLAGIASAFEDRAAAGPLGDELADAVETAIAKLSADTRDAGCRKAADRLARLTGREPGARLILGEAWSDVAIADLAAMEPERRQRWSSLLISCQEAGGGKPTARWLKGVPALVEAVGFDDFKGRLLTWLPLVDRPRTQSRPRGQAWEPSHDDLIEPHHVNMLKGLAWCAAMSADRDLARSLAGLALSSYRKVPGKGPRLVSLGNAAVAALGMMPGLDAVGQLALLKVKIKFGTAQKEVEKALDAAARREGLPRDEVEEMAVPAYGMEEVGRRREELGEYVAEILAEGRDASLRWSKAADGKPLKSVPAAVKKEHADDLKELQGAVKDIGKMLTAQRERIDGLFLVRKPWPFEAWRGRYRDHPLVGVIARRLIWRFESDDRTVDGAWLDGRMVDAHDWPLDGLEASTVGLWHPIGRTIEEVTAWRDWLDRHQIRQPFKQAHREVYVLTDAERNTRVYSNRFAAHVLRQHQYHALCANRGWKNRLRLMVDDSYPATSKDLPEWGLRAEFWVEGIGEEYGRDSTESGAYLHLSTDQVRFYEIAAPQRQAHAGGGGYSTGWNGRDDAEPVPLERVPPLVLSEVLRDVDLFVGVASVGNDPTWADGGPGGRHVDYWQRYSFGDLTANGQTRKAVLERLIPRLKIGPRCSFSDRFLVVKGDLRTYKIHLGSGNILMEPNDQYLCIVPKRSAAEPDGGVFLPFEGDATLSIILSKAMMLADDRKIADPTIVSQIKR